MNSLKAIAAGGLFIIAASLFMQLAYLFIAAGYTSLAKEYPFLNDISGSFRYLVAIPAFLAVMFFGGYITASIARARALLHCVATGLITAGGMTFLAMENADLTTTGMVVLLLSMMSAIAGGWYRQSRSRTKNT